MGGDLHRLQENPDGGTQIGVGYLRETDSAAFYSIYRVSGSSLILHQTRNVILDDRRNYHFAAGDFTDNGNEDVFVGATGKGKRE